MGFLSKLAGRVPVFFIAVGVLLITGSYRGRAGGFETMPMVGLGLIALGVLVFGGLKMTDIGG